MRIISKLCFFAAIVIEEILLGTATIEYFCHSKKGPRDSGARTRELEAEVRNLDAPDFKHVGPPVARHPFEHESAMRNHGR